MQGQVDASLRTEGRTILHVRLTDDPRRFWLMVEQGVVSVCLVDPGFEVDLTVTSDLRSLHLLWLARPAHAEGAAAEPGGAVGGGRHPSRLSPGVWQGSAP